MNDIEKNPFHVENLNSIEKLEKSGFCGSDVSLDISLFEYNLVWAKVEQSYLFVYPIHDQKSFDRTSFKADIDFKIEFDWVEWPEFLDFIGCDFQEWNDCNFGQKIADLYNYYGYENIFGSSYWEGFKISN